MLTYLPYECLRAIHEERIREAQQPLLGIDVSLSSFARPLRGLVSLLSRSRSLVLVRLRDAA
jgi:hypothetical protein